MSITVPRWVWVATAAALVACGGGKPKVETSCSNGLDDNGDGLVDCADPTCSQAPECVAKPECSVQADCLVQSYAGDRPIKQCLATKCVAPAADIEVALQLDTQNYSGASFSLRSLNTRFVLRTAIDGSAVSCATLQALATGTDPASAAQIEASKKFNLLGYDVAPISGTAGQTLLQPHMHTGTGKDFLLWTELWSGPVDATTHMPTGTRVGHGCFDGSPQTDELLASDNNTRTIRVVMPAPE